MKTSLFKVSFAAVSVFAFAALAVSSASAATASATTTGRYQNKSTGHCLANAANSSQSGATVDAYKCSTSKTSGQDLTYNGSTIVSNKLCLKAKGGSGSMPDFSNCGSGSTEQWKYTTSDTIVSKASGLCLSNTGQKVTLAKCTSGNTKEEWTFTAAS